MSIIRDLLEHYRFPPEVKDKIVDFEIKHTPVNGYEVRFYYNNPTRMVVDLFTSDDVRYRRVVYYYNSDLNITEIIHQYDYGKKQRIETFSYGSINPKVVDRVDISETDIDIIWYDLPISTGWDFYSKNITEITGGDNISIDDSNPENPVVSVSGIITGISAGDNILINNTNPKTPVISAGGFLTSITANDEHVLINNTNPQSPSIAVTGFVQSVNSGDNISVDNSDPLSPVINFSGDIGPTISSIVPIYGDIRGGDIFKISSTNLSIEPISCMDSTGIVALYTSSDKIISLPTSPTNTLYHIFAVRLNSDNSTNFRIYLTENDVISDTDINAFRWIGFWRTNSIGECVDAAMVDGNMIFGKASENIIATLTDSYGIVGHSSRIPVKRVSSIVYGVREIGTALSSLDGTSVESLVGINTTSSPDDISPNSWGDMVSGGTKLPFYTGRYFKGNGMSLLCHMVSLRR